MYKNSEIGWKMANGWLLFCTLQIVTFSKVLTLTFKYYMTRIGEILKITNTLYIINKIHLMSYLSSSLNTIWAFRLYTTSLKFLLKFSFTDYRACL